MLQRPSIFLSSREERVLARRMEAQLAALAVSAPGAAAATLLQCKVQEADLPDLLPVLHSQHRPALLTAAHHLALALNNASNINLAVGGVAKIVFALKSYARQSSLNEATPTDLRDSLGTVLTLYQSKFKQGVELVREFAEAPKVLAHADELNQVWTNLIQNALQAMPQQGRLSVRLQGLDGGHVVAVEVGDSGCGIPEQIRDRVFAPFFTTKPIGEGSGLGLDICRKIVEKHGGRIDFESQVGVGTTFRVLLPALGYVMAPGLDKAYRIATEAQPQP